VNPPCSLHGNLHLRGASEQRRPLHYPVSWHMWRRITEGRLNRSLNDKAKFA
jgi:hypothetical protein